MQDKSEDDVYQTNISSQLSENESELPLIRLRKDVALDPVSSAESPPSLLPSKKFSPNLISLKVTSGDQQLQPPSGKDEGYGWIVVFAVFTNNAISAGYMKSFGLLLHPIKERFPDTSIATVGLMMSLLHGCRGILAPAMGAFSVVVGPRVCTVLGALLASTGLLLAVAVFSVPYLAFTVGGLVGVGMCMCETPGTIIVSEYFQVKRATANGFRMSGNPFGGVVFPFLTIFIIDMYPLQGSFILLSGVILQMCVLGMLLRPFNIHKQMKEREYLEGLKANSEINTNEIISLKATLENKTPKKKKPLDFTLLKNPAYLMYIIMIIFSNFALPNVLMYLPLFGRYKGLTEIENSAILSFLSIFDFFCRIFLGWLSDKKIYAKRHGFIFGQLLAGTSLLLLPLTNNLWTILSVMWMRSLGTAFFWTLIHTLLADQFGEDNMATSWGFFRMTQGITNFIYPPLLGLVADMAGTMGAPYMLMGAMQIIGATTFAFQPLVIHLTGVDVKIT